MPNVIRFGAWNVLYSNDNAANFVFKMIKEHNLDVVFLCEISGKRHQEFRNFDFRPTKNDDFRLISPRIKGDKDTMHNGILVRKGISVRHQRSILLSPTYFWTGKGKLAARRYGTHALIDGWLRSLSTHLPASVGWRAGDPNAMPTGPAKRVRAYKGSMRRLLIYCRFGRRMRKHHASYIRFIRRHGTGGSDHPFFTGVIVKPKKGKVTVIWADWNARWGRAIGKFSPAWLARKVRGFRVVHGSGKGPGHNRLDYMVTNA